MRYTLRRLQRALLPRRDRNFLFVWRHRPANVPLYLEWSDPYKVIFPCSDTQLPQEAYENMGLAGAAYRIRRAKGDSLGVILYGDTIAHRSLLQRHGTAALEGDLYALRLKAHQAYIHWCETAPEHRGRGLYPRMLAIMASYACYELGCQEVFIACRQNNTASVQGILKAGFTYFCSSVSVSILGGRVCLRHWYEDPCGPA